MNALATLQALYPTFTKTEKQIADHLLAEGDTHVLLNITLSDFAQSVGVGQASIIRMIKKCGYNSYRNFILSFHQSRFESSMAARVASRQQGSKLLEEIALQLRLCEENLSKTDLRLAATRIRKADTIICLGYGDSNHVAAIMASRLRRMNLMAVHIVPGEVDLAGVCMSNQTRTVSICFSISGETENILQIARRHANADSFVIAVTSAVESRLSKIADLTFYAPSKTTKGSHVRDIEGITTSMYVIEAIMEEYMSQFNQQEE